jgi:hypothetical protein
MLSYDVMERYVNIAYFYCHVMLSLFIIQSMHAIGSLFNILNIGNIDSPPTNRYAPSNIRRRITSTGKHLFSYYACKRRRRQQSIISGSNQPKNDKSHHETSKDIPPSFRPMETYIDDFRPMDNPSCQDHTWYDAICPYWTGGMIWDSAYVLNHQVVSVNTDPIFVSNLTPALELSATIQTQKPRSEGENAGLRTTIALDSGSSIHIFKDSFLLTDIHADNTRSIGVCTTDSKFRLNNIGRLCNDLNTLPLPSEGYYFYPKGVVNILSLAMKADSK